MGYRAGAQGLVEGFAGSDGWRFRPGFQQAEGQILAVVLDPKGVVRGFDHGDVAVGHATPMSRPFDLIALVFELDTQGVIHLA